MGNVEVGDKVRWGRDGLVYEVGYADDDVFKVYFPARSTSDIHFHGYRQSDVNDDFSKIEKVVEPTLTASSHESFYTVDGERKTELEVIKHLVNHIRLSKYMLMKHPVVSYTTIDQETVKL